MAPDPLHRVVTALAAATADLASDDLAFVACSGGPDSLALAAAAARLAGAEGSPRFGAVVVDHGLQDDSARVCAAAVAACQSLALDPVVAERVDVATGPGQGGLEAAARRARRAALAAAAGRHDARAVLLAHTMDDQAETVLLGLARGSGSRSLAGMAPRDGIWRRPLLGIRREVTAAAAAQAGLSPHRDAHNEDERFARVRVRVRLLPQLEADLGPGVTEALARTGSMLRADDEALDAMAAGWLADFVPPGRADVGLAASAAADLASQPAAVRTRVLRRCCLEAGCSPGALTFDHIREVDRLISDWRGQGEVFLPGGVRASRRSGGLSWTRRPPPRR